MIARLIPLDSPLRNDPFVRSFFSARANQTRLSIARVYYGSPGPRAEIASSPGLTIRPFVSTAANPSSIIPQPADLGCTGVRSAMSSTSLLDVGNIRDAHSPETQIHRILTDLQRVYPDADPALAKLISYADIHPEVLYLSEQPSISGLDRFFLPRTGRRRRIGMWPAATAVSSASGWSPRWKAG